MKPVALQYPNSQPLGSESPNALPARMTAAMENLDCTLHPEMVGGFVLSTAREVGDKEGKQRLVVF